MSAVVVKVAVDEPTDLARHDRRPGARALLAARDAGADEEAALRLDVGGAPDRVGEERVAAVDEDVARLGVRQHRLDELVDRRARPSARSMIRRGALSVAHISSIECAPTIFVPFASFARNSSTFAVVRLYAVTTKPLSFMLRMRFCPITARPITAMSEVRAGGAVAGAMFSFISAIGVVEEFAEERERDGADRESLAPSSCCSCVGSRHTNEVTEGRSWRGTR